MVSKHSVLSLPLYDEGCERFCFYGLRSLLFLFVRTEYNLSYSASLLIVHAFLGLSYSFSILAGIALELLAGNLKAMIFFSMAYILGAFILTFASISLGSLFAVVIGLFLISMGIGGIKSCTALCRFEDEAVVEIFPTKPVSAASQQPSKIYKALYFITNGLIFLSAIWAPLLVNISCLGRDTCYFTPFALSSLLLCSSVGLLFFGNRYFVYDRSNRQADRETCRSLFSLAFSACKNRVSHRQTQALSLDTIEAQLILELRRIGRLSHLFIPIAFFWMLVDQQYTSWIEQGLKMRSSLIDELRKVSRHFIPINSFIMVLIVPLITMGIFFFLSFYGHCLRTPKSAVVAVLLGSLSFFISAGLEFSITCSSIKLSILWQIPQYALMSLAELLIGMSGISIVDRDVSPFVSIILLLVWLFSVALGNIFVIVLSYLFESSGFTMPNSQLVLYCFFAILGFGATISLRQHLAHTKS